MRLLLTLCSWIQAKYYWWTFLNARLPTTSTSHYLQGITEHGLNTKELVYRRVADYYWHDDINCATTSLKILSEIIGIDLSDQVIDAAIGMHGAGEYGAQCGLVEGTLMFLGILGRSRNIPDDAIVRACKAYAGQFEKRFHSLSCMVLRPEGFDPNNPPHLCEAFTREAIGFAIEFISVFLNRTPRAALTPDLCIETSPS